MKHNEDQIEVMQNVLDKLIFVQNNFGDLDALKEKISTNFGVCSAVGMSSLDYFIDPDFKRRMFKAWPDICMFDQIGKLVPNIAYPVEGSYEYYNSPAAQIWSNPKRLKFIQHCIQYIKKYLESL